VSRKAASIAPWPSRRSSRSTTTRSRPRASAPPRRARGPPKGGILAADEALLHPDPFESREAWCSARVALTEPRLLERARTHALVLVGHWPLRRDLVRLGRVPRYSPWCGTRLTEAWHTRFGAAVVVSGHLHVRATDVRDGVRFEEVSVGYPRDWDPTRGLASYLRRIL
jgi:hypothetical protein